MKVIVKVGLPFNLHVTKLLFFTTLVINGRRDNPGSLRSQGRHTSDFMGQRNKNIQFLLYEHFLYLTELINFSRHLFFSTNVLDTWDAHASVGCNAKQKVFVREKCSSLYLNFCSKGVISVPHHTCHIHGIS